jgi:sigma-54 dependent transcriptional regulator, acetoin dehydrogenase operon transcriptional activator AcoR
MDFAETAAERAHTILEQEGRLSPELLPADIYQSWERCLALGLDPRRRAEVKVEPIAKLKQARERLGLARRLALAELHGLHAQIVGTSFVIAFADADCMILDVITDPAHATGASIREGSIWSEATCGTNALGAALIQRQPACVHRAEHFFVEHLGLTCIAQPVFGPDGTLVGVIDATSSDCESRQRHTKALVQLAATQIENGLFRGHNRGQTIIAFHKHPESLHSLSAGLMAVSDEGLVVGANAQARDLLRGRSTNEALIFEDLFDLKFTDLLAEGRRSDTIRLRDRFGLLLAARMEADRGHRGPHAMTRSHGRLPAASGPSPRRLPFVADDPSMMKILTDVEMAARRRWPILIRGETGTGKELMARYAHTSSGRKGPFVPVNCAALPENLIEAELFGYADGAFTGGRRGGAKGLVSEADGGTLFLDEIGDLPMVMQAVLLRLLDDWTVRPIGGQRFAVDVQLVSATNVNLTSAVAAGRFRSDLLYRMNAVEIALPSLAMRSDIAAIAEHLLAVLAPDCQLDEGAIAHIEAHVWPGNIRQLRNELARASLKAVNGIVDRSAIESACTTRHGNGHVELAPSGTAARAREAANAGNGQTGRDLIHEDAPTLRSAHRDMVLAALADADGNISLAARCLRVSRNTIYRVLGSTKVP